MVSFYNEALLARVRKEGFEIDFDPPGDGMCFYASTGHQLGMSANAVHKLIFKYLRQHRYEDNGDDRLSFLCSVDLGGKEVPVSWSKALDLLKDNSANSMVIRSVPEILHHKVVIVTVLGSSSSEYVKEFVPKKGPYIGTLYYGHTGDHYVALKPFSSRQSDENQMDDISSASGSPKSPPELLDQDSDRLVISPQKVETKTKKKPDNNHGGPKASQASVAQDSDCEIVSLQKFGSKNKKAKRRTAPVMDWWDDEDYQPGIAVFRGVKLDPIDLTQDRMPSATKRTQSAKCTSSPKMKECIDLKSSLSYSSSDEEPNVPAVKRQQKIGPSFWENVEVEKADHISEDIDGLAVYKVQQSEQKTKSCMSVAKDGRTWKKHSETEWAGYNKGQNFSKRRQGSEEKPFDRVSGLFAVRSTAPEVSEVLHNGNQPDRPGPEESVEFSRPSCEPNVPKGEARVEKSRYDYEKDRVEQFSSKPSPWDIWGEIRKSADSWINTWPHESDDHDDEDLLVSERVTVTSLLLDRVGGYDELCNMLLQNKSLSEVEWVINEANSCTYLCNFLKEHKTITSLAVHMGWINGSAARALSETLKANTTITSLTLHGKWSDPFAAGELSEVLKTNKTITSLSLHGEWSDCSATAVLIEALKTNTTITSLSLHGKWNNGSAAAALSEALTTNTTITSLTLDGEWIDDSAAYVLSKALQTNITITSLALHGEWIDGSSAYELSETLKTNTTIVSLTLHGECSDRSAAAALAEALKTNKTITSLSLHGNWSDLCVAAPLQEALITNTTITALTLHGEWSDRSAADALSETLKRNKTITSLTVHGKWSDSFAAIGLTEVLKMNTTITSLSLHGEWSNFFAAAKLAQALMTNKTITSLSLHGKSSDFIAAGVFAEALKTNKTITSLSLHGKWSDRSATAVLSKALITNTTINKVTINGKWSDRSAADALSEMLKSNKTITDLSFDAQWNDPAAAAALSETLKTNKNITGVHLYGDWSGRSAAASLAESLKTNTNIHLLALDGTWSDRSAALAISNTLKTNTSIFGLALEGKWSDPSTIDALLETLKTNTTISSLILRGNWDDRSAAPALSEILKKITANTSLKLNWKRDDYETSIANTLLTLEGEWSDHFVAAAISEILKTNTSIITVTLFGRWSDPCASAALVKTLQTNTTITLLMFHGTWNDCCASDALSETLMTNKTIWKIELYGVWNDCSAAAALSEALKTNTAAALLTLIGTWRDRYALDALLETLKTNTAIYSLTFSGNWRDRSATAALVETLKRNTTINRVILHGNWSDSAAVAALSKTFKTRLFSKDLLFIIGSWSAHSSAAALSESLKTNTTITSLTLDGTWSDRSVAAIFSEALKMNRTITSLTIYVTWSDHSVAAVISETLKTNETITSLTLHGKWSDRSAARALSETLKTNRTITSLTLHGEWSDPFAARELSETLKTNRTITSLTLYGELSALDIAAALSEALKTNTTITSLTVLGKWSDPCASAAVLSKVLRKGLTITLDRDNSMVIGVTDQSYPRCLWISELEETDDSGIVCKQGYPKALRNERAKTCLDPLYIECSGCSFELFTALRNECCKWSGVLCCEGFVLSMDNFTLAVRDEKLFYLHIGWHSNFIKIILETQADSVSTELLKTLSGEIRQFLETTLELLRTKLQNIAEMRCVFMVENREDSSICNVHKLQGCLDENCIQLSPIGRGPEAANAASGNWCYRDEEKKQAPTQVDMFMLSLDLGHQWTTLRKLLGLSESVQILLDQDKSEDQLKCLKMLMIWLKVGYSVTFETLGKALMHREMKRDDLFLKHCKEEKQLSKWFTITPQGGQVSYLGCTIDIPEGSIESEAELCLGFLKTGPPEGDCVAPVLHVQTKPGNLCLKKPVTMTLPIFVSPVELDEFSQPDLTLMCFNEGLWKEISSPKLSFSQTSFEVTHFSGFTAIIRRILKSLRSRPSKNLACYLFGEGIPDSNLLDMRICVCGNSEPGIKMLRESYNDYIKLDGGNNFVVSQGCDIVVSSYIEPVVTAASVTPDKRIFKSRNLKSTPVWQVEHFEVNMMPPIPSETKVVCGLAEKDERNASPEPSTRLQFYLKAYEKQQIAHEKKKKITSYDIASGSSDGPVEKEFGRDVAFVEEPQRVTASKKLKVVLLCDVWRSSKGGLSTFNRQLATNLAKQSDLKVFCYLREVSDRDKSAAIKDNVTLVEAEDIPFNSDPMLKLHCWPSQWPSPDVIISHGRKFGIPAFFIKDRCPSCKWVHFVHKNYEEMGKYKVGSNEIKRSNAKDAYEMRCCRSADVVVAVGPQLLDRCNRSLSIKQKKAQEFYPGLSKEFQNLPQKTSDSKDFHVYIFCRCSSEDFELNGVDLLADAVGKLGKNYKVHVVGVPKGEEQNTLQLILDKTELKKGQLFVRCYCNNLQEMKEMMCEADLVVMPSRAEAFGQIGLEALSAGVPLLVSAASGLGMTLKKLTFGHICVVESDSFHEWAQKIELLKEKERSQRFKQIKKLRKHYDEKYKWEEQCAVLAKLFREINVRADKGKAQQVEIPHFH